MADHEVPVKIWRYSSRANIYHETGIYTVIMDLSAVYERQASQKQTM